MKITTMLAAAGIALASLGVSVAADAQPRRHDDRGHRDGGSRYGRHDNGNHYGRQSRRRRQSCRTVYRHGHRQRVCR